VVLFVRHPFDTAGRGEGEGVRKGLGGEVGMGEAGGRAKGGRGGSDGGRGDEGGAERRGCGDYGSYFVNSRKHDGHPGALESLGGLTSQSRLKVVVGRPAYRGLRRRIAKKATKKRCIKG